MIIVEANHLETKHIKIGLELIAQWAKPIGGCGLKGFYLSETLVKKQPFWLNFE